MPRKAFSVEDSVAVRCPEILPMWHENNVSPYSIRASSHKKVLFRCQTCGNVWSTEVRYPALQKTGCPYCTKRMISEKNSLKILYPEFEKQYDSEFNAISFEDLTVASNYKVLWNCTKCRQKYFQKVYDHVRFPKACPVCSGKRVVYGINDLASQEPKLAKEIMGNPKTIAVTAKNREQQWCCSKCGHIYRVSVMDRRQGSGCPVCAGKHQGYGSRSLIEAVPWIRKYLVNPEQVRGLDVNTVTKEIRLLDEHGHQFRAAPAEIVHTSEDQLWMLCPSCMALFQQSLIRLFCFYHKEHSGLGEVRMGTDNPMYCNAEIYLPKYQLILAYQEPKKHGTKHALQKVETSISIYHEIRYEMICKRNDDVLAVIRELRAILEKYGAVLAGTAEQDLQTCIRVFQKCRK